MCRFLSEESDLTRFPFQINLWKEKRKEGKVNLSSMPPSIFEIEEDYVSAPRFMEKVYDNIVSGWLLSTTELSLPHKIRIQKRENEQREPVVRINRFSHGRFGKRNWFFGLGVWQGTPRYVYVLFASTFDFPGDLSAWERGKRFIGLVSGANYLKSALLHVGDDEIVHSQSHPLSAEVKRSFHARQTEGGIIAGDGGGLVYANPECRPNYFAQPFLDEMKTILAR